MVRAERARRRREADVRRAVQHRREVDGDGDEGLFGPGRLDGREGHVEHRGSAVVVHPDLHGIAADESQVLEIAGVVVVVACRFGHDRCQAVHVDADVVTADVPKLRVEDGVKLDREDVVACVAVVLGVEEAEELARRRHGQVLGGRDEEGEPVPAHRDQVGDNGEHEGGLEGACDGAVGFVEAEGRRVEGAAFELGSDVGERELAVRLDHGHAVEVELRTIKAIVDEVPVTAGEEVEEEQREEGGDGYRLEPHLVSILCLLDNSCYVAVVLTL